jgi:hypothetical protein
VTIPTPYEDAKIVGTPAWWLARLQAKLGARLNELDRYDDYYSGKHNLRFATEKFRQRFGNLFGPLSDNWCDVVVQAVEDRLEPQGFRIPGDPTDAAPGDNSGVVQGDKVAWDIWQRNNLDEFSHVAHEEALVKGECSALVWYGEDADVPVITLEDATQMICEKDPERSTEIRAALKRWIDDTGYVFATLYLPEAIFKFQSDRPTYSRDGKPQALAQAAKFVPREAKYLPDGETWPLENRLGVVPVVPIENRSRLLKPGVSEIAQVIPMQDAVNKLLADMLIASEYQSFKQRALLGIDIPRDPETGEIIEGFYKQLIEKIWFFEAAENGQTPSIWESSEINLTYYVEAVNLGVHHIASRTRTPSHYFLDPAGQYPSGESLTAAETGLVFKTRRKMVSFGERWEQVIRLGLKVINHPKADEWSSETIWKNPESRNIAVMADAAVKAQQAGLPEEMIWERYLGLSPEEIQRAKQLRAAAAAKPASGDIVPTVEDPVTGETVQIKDPNLRHEAPPGQMETPAPVGAGVRPGG